MPNLDIDQVIKDVLAREIHDKLHNKVDPVLLHTLMAMAEAHGVLKKQVMELADTVNRTLDMLEDTQLVQGKMKDVIDKLRKHESDADLDDPVSTTEH